MLFQIYTSRLTLQKYVLGNKDIPVNREEKCLIHNLKVIEKERKAAGKLFYIIPPFQIKIQISRKTHCFYFPINCYNEYLLL